MNSHEILGEFQMAKIIPTKYKEKKFAKLVPAKISSLKVGTSNERQPNNIIIQNIKGPFKKYVARF